MVPSVFYRLSFTDLDAGSNEMLFGPTTLAAVCRYRAGCCSAEPQRPIRPLTSKQSAEAHNRVSYMGRLDVFRSKAIILLNLHAPSHCGIFSIADEPQIQHQMPTGPHRGGQGMNNHQQRKNRHGSSFAGASTMGAMCRD